MLLANLNQRSGRMKLTVIQLAIFRLEYRGARVVCQCEWRITKASDYRSKSIVHKNNHPPLITKCMVHSYRV